MAKYKITDAAAILGVSVDTIRRRVKSGQLPAEKVSDKNVPTWYVELDDASRQDAQAVQGAAPSEDLIARLKELERDRDAWREQATRLMRMMEVLGISPR